MTKEFTFKEKYIGDKAFYSKVATILIPIIIQNTVTNVVSLLDNIMVGRVGTLEMSAVAIVNQLLFVFYICIFGGLSGVGIFTAQFAGTCDRRGIQNCLRMKLYIALVMTALALVVFIAFPKNLISMYLARDTDPAKAAATLGFALDYLAVMLVGVLPFAISQVYGSHLRELGETRIPMLASVTAIIVNLIFNYILIFGRSGIPFLPFEGLGVVGAAIATSLSRFVEMAMILFFVHNKKSKFDFVRGVYSTLKVPVSLCFNIFKRGTPLLLNEFLWALGTAMLSQCYSVRGLEVVAASNISSTVANLFNVVFLSMGSAIAIMIGQLLGADRVREAKLSVSRFLMLTVISCIVMGSIMLICAPFIPLIYNTTDAVRDTATQLLCIVAVAMPFLGFTHSCYFTLRSGGKTLITFLFDSGFMWLLSFPTAFLLANYSSIPIVILFLTVQLLEVIKCIVGGILIKKGLWINNIINRPIK